jgi:superfamily II DNA or RNA helicase
MFENYSPQTLRDAIEYELIMNDDIKSAAIAALAKLKENPIYYDDKFSNMFKARKASVGDIRKWKGGWYQKKPSGEWVPVAEKKGLFSGLLAFFGLKSESDAKKRAREEYQKYQSELKGISSDTFIDYMSEYLLHKDEWDKRFQKKLIITRDKKTGETRKIQVKEKKEKKEAIISGKKKYSLAIMKQVAGIVNKIKQSKEVTDEERRESTAISPGIPAAGTGGRELKLAREEFTRKPTKDFLPENLARTLRQHQKDFVNLAIENFTEKNHRGIFNMDGTGAGKTLQELGLAQVYLQKEPGKPVLIVTENKRIINTAFANDAKLAGIEFEHIESASDATENKIYVTTYNRLKDFKGKDFGLAIFDESHNLKNKSKKTEYGEEIISKAKNVALFSATPIDKGVQVGYIAKSFNLRKSQLMAALGYELKTIRTPYGKTQVYEAGEEPEEIANRIDALFASLTREGMAVKREVSLENLDTKITNVELNEDQRNRFNSAYSSFLADIGKDPMKKASGLMKLRRFVEELKIETTTNRILDELKSNSKKQIVLFATRVNDSEVYDEESLGSLKEISRILKEKGIDHVNVFSSSKTAVEDIKKFQDGSVRVILTTPPSGGTGLSLDDTTGDRPRKAIVMTPPFSAMDFVQISGRINRLNTKSRAEVEMLSTKTFVDEWNKDIIANKLLTLGSAVSGDYKKIDIKEMDRLQYMPKEDQRKYMEQKKIDQKVSYVEERNININDFMFGAEAKTDTAGKTIITKPLRNIDSYITFIPKSPKDEFPDAEIGFGKYKGKNLSAVQDRDPGYLRWMVEQMRYKFDNGERLEEYVGRIKFVQEMKKAFGLYRIFNTDTQKFDYFKKK